MSPEAPLKRRPRKAFDWSSATIAVAVVVSAAVVYWRDGEARFLEILISDTRLFVDVLPKVLAACLIAAFVAIGADTGAAIAFITSWTLLGYARILVWELPFFGGEFVIWRTIISLPLPIVAGLLARVLICLHARTKSEGGG